MSVQLIAPRELGTFLWQHKIVFIIVKIIIGMHK
jgi:hypothetical protein